MKQLMPLCILALLFFAARSAAGQAAPQFAATIYVEDAIGNVDSVVVGFDTLATTGIDDYFGEVVITEPFDSVLDVRAGSFLGLDRNKLSKSIFEFSEAIFPVSENTGCYTAPSIFIYIWSKHQPVTVTWDKSLFLNDVCVRGGMLTNHYLDELSGQYDWGSLPANIEVCMGDDESWTIDVSEETILSSNIIAPIYIEKEVNGLGVKDIYGLRFFPSPTFTGWTPCSYVTSIPELEFSKEMPMVVYPNPVRGQLGLELPENVSLATFQLFNTQGQLISYGRKIDQLDFKNFDPGFYILRVIGSDGKMYVSRIMKQ